MQGDDFSRLRGGLRRRFEFHPPGLTAPASQGSLVAWSNAGAGATYAYGAWGEPQSWNGLPRFAYTGQTVIPGAKLYHYKARVYDPAYGRFLQTDPIGTKDDLNLYAYVGGDPVNRGDPTGLRNCTSSIAAIDCGTPTDTTTVSTVTVTKKKPEGAPPPFLVVATVTVQWTYYGYPVGNPVVWPIWAPNPIWILDQAIQIDDDIQALLNQGSDDADGKADDNKQNNEPKGGHRTGKRPSTKGKHEKGDKRRGRDQGGEKGDARRPYQR